MNNIYQSRKAPQLQMNHKLMSPVAATMARVFQCLMRLQGEKYRNLLPQPENDTTGPFTNLDGG